jgi:hypothetical protein
LVSWNGDWFSYVCPIHAPKTASFNPRVRGTCLVSVYGTDTLKAGRALQGGLFKFQSPCAGNMFGKQLPTQGPPQGGLGCGFQSPCAGNMFGKLSLRMTARVWFPRWRFNPRVRGTCLVSSRPAGSSPAAPRRRSPPGCTTGCFNPRVRGTCLVRRKVGGILLVERAVGPSRGFNPRVRGTCLVRATRRPQGVWPTRAAFQSPCAGNMFGKRCGEPGYRPVRHQGGFNPRVRGTCLVSHKNLPLDLWKCPKSCFNPRVRGTCLVSGPHKPAHTLDKPLPGVSIPVCGEHVW